MVFLYNFYSCLKCIASKRTVDFAKCFLYLVKATMVLNSAFAAMISRSEITEGNSALNICYVLTCRTVASTSKHLLGQYLMH